MAHRLPNGFLELQKCNVMPSIVVIMLLENIAMGNLARGQIGLELAVVVGGCNEQTVTQPCLAEERRINAVRSSQNKLVADHHSRTIVAQRIILPIPDANGGTRGEVRDGIKKFRTGKLGKLAPGKEIGGRRHKAENALVAKWAHRG